MKKIMKIIIKMIMKTEQKIILLINLNYKIF